MPELPEITVYVERLRALAKGQRLSGIRLASPFVLRTVEPAPAAFAGRVLGGVDRIGKRIVLGFDEEQYAVIHLMLAGRLKWRAPGAALPRGTGMLAFDFAAGSLVLIEASTKHRASLHLVSGRAELAQFDRGGVDVLSCPPDALGAALRLHNRTLKRALTDPAVADGIGNKFSDEILHRARLSPFALSGNLDGAEVARLHAAAREVLCEWIPRLRAEAGDGFPEKETGRGQMAVHGKFGQPCPVCGAPVQRIVYAESESNYCPGCQTGGRILADRSLSRLLKDDWPRTLEELERVRPIPR
ncbi:MAG: DNA-formamidopyrimidine glycosylase family protein [Bacillota bacterium]|nr:DNA-formamidopyrimidine glycosylase family protein [Bacillota bacterium]